MAKFSAELPIDLINQFTELYKSGATEMMKEMTQAGAEIAYNNIKANMKSAFKNPESLEPHLKITKTYRSMYDDGINTKVAFYGYKKGTEGKTTKSTKTHTYGKLNNKDKTIWQNRGRVGQTSVKTYSHNYGVPVPMIVIQREYGNSKTGEKKKPFIRPAFKKAQITQAMLKVQEKYLKDE